MAKLKFDTIADSEEVEILGTKVTVKRFINFEDQQRIISKYLRNMFGSEDEEAVSTFPEYVARNRFLAEVALRHDIWTMMTDVEFPLVGKEKKPEVPEKLLFDDDLFYSLLNAISNWQFFYQLLVMITEDVEKEIYIASSVGGVLDDLAERLIKWVESADFDFEGIGDAVKKMGEAVKESNLVTLMDESQKV